MPITEEQRLERVDWIGSSDLAPILSADEYRTAHDVWLEKTRKLDGQPIENPAMDAGTRFEGAVLDWAEEQLGYLQRNKRFVKPELHLAVNTDAIQASSDDPVEAKTSGLLGPLPDGWGDPETSNVPDRVVIQCHGHMLATGKSVCHVPTFLGGRGFVMYHVPFDERLAGIIGEACIDFWENHVQPDIPPTDSAPSIEVIKRIRHIPNKIIQIDGQLVAKWEAAKQIEKEARDHEKEIRGLILAALGDAEAADYGDPDYLFTYYPQDRKAYHVKAATYRVPRIVKRKKG